MVKIFPNSLDALNNSQYLADRARQTGHLSILFSQVSLLRIHITLKRIKE
ncbi:hypothetical protein Ct9H90mP29_03140 [bacterium]|nr:MAG: hypothetical protein Ct9H90mP29_03140 [bacterium]